MTCSDSNIFVNISAILNLTFLSLYPQLDEVCIKPRPGSDVSNVNAPSPPHKVQSRVFLKS